MLRIAADGIKILCFLLVIYGLILAFGEAIWGQRTLSERYQIPPSSMIQENPQQYDRDMQELFDKMALRLDEIERNTR